MEPEGPGPPFKPDLYIVTRIIEKLLQSKDNKLKRTQLQMKSGLNWTIFTKYLNLLVDKKILIIQEDREGIWVTTTPEGRKTYNDLLALFRTIMGEKWMQEKRHQP